MNKAATATPDAAATAADTGTQQVLPTISRIPADLFKGSAPAPTASPPTEATADTVRGAEGIKEAVSQQSETVGDIVDTIDRLAISAGSTRISLWDIMVVLLVILAVIAAAYFASKLARSTLNRISGIGDAQRLLLDKLLTIAVWTLAILIGVDVLGIDLTTLAVFSGAMGLAIGFGLQKTFGNLIAGIILLMDKSIKPGDVIAIADLAGQTTFGQIRKIGIRAVSVTTRDQREYLIPNENLMINQVENWSYSSRNVRMQVEVGVSYDADITLAEDLMLQAARSCKRVLDAPPPTVWLKEFADSSVRFTIHCWITDPEEGIGNIRSEVLKKLWWLFKENDIELPLPQRELNLRDNREFRDLLAVLRDREDGRSDN